MPTEEIRDSVEVALELDEREVYSHIAHESAEDIRRIISSIDAERAQKKGFLVYYHDDWDNLIRERIRKGKRHTAFDFYNPELLDIWEAKVEELKGVRRTRYFLTSLLIAGVIVSIIAGLFFSWYLTIPGLAALPFVVWVQDWAREKSDLIYHQLTQFFIDEMRALLAKYGLDPEKYKFKLFNDDYFGVRRIKIGRESFAVVEPLNDVE
ncbi:hypothetical protein X802_06510 [Thermococcus guaymasensis DSM 11113]|uniref:Uncharacterized protein n=1 Tax=Thermococcus guaymasensis DSM 11113 TaxID=1432656 RepID=A0A0X1KKU5_9EURY|nr:hypothetical protein [Thermococcus guaymasensis]AJC71850.1 hypothetical protein X802_06510 [Thermococcus guaymasensis DSM 11113]